MKILIWIVSLVWICFATASADDLYRVEVGSELDARRLAATGVDPVIGLSAGYLVLADGRSLPRLNESGLIYTIVTGNVTREQLALGGRREPEYIEMCSPLFQEGGVRLYLADPIQFSALFERGDLIRVGDRRPKIGYTTPRNIDFWAAAPAVDLEWLISLVDRDSLETYVTRLQSFYRRYAGSMGDQLAGSWLASKLTDFGYDSVVADTIPDIPPEIHGTCWNILAYKIGSRFPNHHVIVGGHRDAAIDSPGADDNGSGAAGVLEIARVLKDIDTDITIVFALFDAEEIGLYGSWHYAEEAAARGDSIVYMLNMDMIGHYTNDVLATLHHGSDITYSLLWQTIADSLVGLSAFLSGNSCVSDHFPFTQYGYPGTYVVEYYWSTVYHSPHDSTTYMNFEYMTRMVQASLATVYMATASAGPRPGLAFEYPGGLPDMIPPGTPATFEVSITGTQGGMILPGSAQLHYSTNGVDYTMIAMPEISANLFEASIPPMLCDEHVNFFISAVESEGVTFNDYGPDGFYSANVATGTVTVFVDNFENDLGWTVSSMATSGQWERGIPLGDGGNGDPLADCDSSGWCFLTGNAAGDSDVDSGGTFLNSPNFDLSIGGNPVISYARWFANNAGGGVRSDYFLVTITNDNGGSWHTVEYVGPIAESAGGWYEYSFAVNDIIPLTSQVRVRFIASDYGEESIVEAGLDAFAVTRYVCEGEEDWDDDGILNLADNCPFVPNQQQENNDGDDRGDLCDDDDDNDRVLDGMDNCPYAANEDQLDADGDGLGDVCDDCDCTGLGDLNRDDMINPVDVVLLVNYVYRLRDGRELLTTACAAENGDWDCNGIINPVDVVYYTNFVYKSIGMGPCDPCVP